MGGEQQAPLPLLVLSDGKPGHLNQSLALGRHLGRSCTTVAVRFRNRFCKLLSYPVDQFHLFIPGLIQVEPLPKGDFSAIVATGSETYYAARILGRRLGLPIIAIMLPRGYRLDFDLIIAPAHDRPPRRANILTLPVNLSYAEAKGVFQGNSWERYVGLVIGGPNRSYAMPLESMRRTISAIFAAFPDHQVVVTTSRRTPGEIESLLESFPFAEQFVYSRNPVNPIPDFLNQCESVFITADSTSMISEAVTVGSSRVEIIPLPELRHGHKYARLIGELEALGCVHRFLHGQPGNASNKIDLGQKLQGVQLCG